MHVVHKRSRLVGYKLTSQTPQAEHSGDLMLDTALVHFNCRTAPHRSEDIALAEVSDVAYNTVTD